MTDAPALRARGLAKRFGHQRALAGLDLDVREGELLTLFGPNGAGKTTFLRLLAGLTRPTAGTVTWRGADVRDDLDALRRRLGFVSHQTMLHDCLSAQENLTFAARLHGLDRPGPRIEALLGELDLTDRAADPVGALSRGLQQRVAVARALLHDPELILLDEPFSGLDQHASRVLSSRLAVLRGRGRTILLVTHDLARGLELADRIAVLRRGRLVLERGAAGLSVLALERLYLEALDGAAPVTSQASP